MSLGVCKVLKPFSVHLRFLKTKCDGVKPVCGPCRMHPKDDDCEYSDGPGRSRTKVLEDTVSRLEARLHELENPDDTTPSVTLHDPYRSYHDSQQLSKSPPSLLIPETHPYSPLSPFSPTSTSSSLPSGRPWRSFSALDTKTESGGSSGSSSSPQRQYTSSPFLGTDEPGFITIQTLLDKFLPHCLEFGFFLNPNRFREATLLPLSFGHPSRPSPAVLSAVYLWGVHLSHSEPLLLQEHSFMTRALQHAATDLLGAHPDVILHTLQAEVLLAYYLLRIGRFLEAKCHTANAVSLALAAGFHKIRSTNLYAPLAIGLSSDTPISLHPPRDVIEEGERINGFWAVLMLHKYITIALEPPMSVCGTLEAPGIQIDTPWPLDISHYSEGLLYPDVRGNSTVRNFLLNSVETGNQGHSTTALNVKAAILFHRSAQLAGQWTPNMQTREFYAYTAAFQSINRVIETFRTTLPPLAQLDVKHPGTRALLLIHALTDAATIKLHINFSYADSSSKQHCLTAARNMVTFGGLNIQEVGYMNPIMGTLWVAACHVFIDEISRVRSLANAWPPNTEGSEDELMERLRSGMAALSALSDESSLTKYQLTKVQEAFSAI
ncbi:hypothetical protein D9615_005944 [Tricholomella constricta]|uniref:Transcription factor domain-containing protein n=1 Tax=Tricholomella constricta TaxID=117010 RepID=A0A8H5H979_9AGAR|nr:hypothetical protein D9615_005944 [Tricholomella constricta]